MSGRVVSINNGLEVESSCTLIVAGDYGSLKESIADGYGWYTVSIGNDYGSHTLSICQMVTNKCGVIDMSWKGKIEVKGPDAQELLEYAVCGEVSGVGDEWETSPCRKCDRNGNGVVWEVVNVALSKM